jgi:hypothetical protein
MRKMTMLVTAGWGSSPKYWVRAVPNHNAVSDAALGDVDWGEQILEADQDPMTAYLRVPLESIWATDRIRADFPDESLRGQKLSWPSSLGELGMNGRKPYRTLSQALAVLVKAWRDAGWDVKVVDRRDDGGGFA